MIEILREIQDRIAEAPASAVAVGVFDGVHIGHQQVLRQTVREAASQGLRSVALTFDIHPAALLAPARAPAALGTLDERCALIGRYGGVDSVAVVRFDRAFASATPESFVDEILIDRLGARHVLVGADFRYGRDRAGDVTTLLEIGARRGYVVTVVPPVLAGGDAVSSTRIRTLLAEGDLEMALALLGHPYLIAGHVIADKRLGRTLGYPTANISPDLATQMVPGAGIYAAYATLADGDTVRAAVSIGTNPTTDTDDLRKIEAYLMDGFSADLYGQELTLDFRYRLRGEQKFDSLDSLTAQIARDVDAAAHLLEPPEGRS